MPITTQVVILRIGTEDEITESLKRSVLKGEELSFIHQRCPQHTRMLAPHAIEQRVHLWACTSHAGRAIASDVSRGGRALVLFIHQGFCVATARLMDTFVSTRLASDLWHHSEIAESYHHFMALSQPRRIANTTLTDILGQCLDKSRSGIGPSYLIIDDGPSIAQIERLLEPRVVDPPIIFPPLDNPDKELGDAGELWVVEELKRKLRSKDRIDLIGRIDHVAARGVTPGYDLEWINPDNNQLEHIEVKTTRGGLHASFYLTKNEKDTMDSKEATYRIYRVYNFDHDRGYETWTVADFRRFETTPIHFVVKPLCPPKADD